MDIRPIRTDDDHKAAVREIEKLWGAAQNTPEGDRLDVLVTLVDAYEAKRWPLPECDPVEAIKNSMEMEGYRQADLARLLGSSSRASEVLNRKRSLTVEMLHKIHTEWHVPAEALIRPYALKRA